MKQTYSRHDFHEKWRRIYEQLKSQFEPKEK